jgi:hypothetical protein
MFSHTGEFFARQVADFGMSALLPREGTKTEDSEYKNYVRVRQPTERQPIRW